MPSTIERIREALAPTVVSLTNDFYPNLVSFKRRVNNSLPSGAPTYSWDYDTALGHLRALILPATQYLEQTAAAGFGGGTRGLTIISGDFIVSLGSYHGTIDTSMKMEDHADGVEYDVVGTQTDPLRLAMQVQVRRTDPNADH